MIGLTRVRNESLIFEDTLNHFLSVCDRVIVYDDCSTDNTAEIAQSFDRVDLIRGAEWSLQRTAEETRHRALLLDRAKEKGAEWCLYFDADERIEGPLPDFTACGYRLRLFDAYLTPDCPGYTGGELSTLPRLFGPEYRDILMLFRADSAEFQGLDQRAPVVSGPVVQSELRVKHYGKGISVEQWEETCDYYVNHFPEPYISKWSARKGKAVHSKSDFGRPLYPWHELPKHEIPL